MSRLVTVTVRSLCLFFGLAGLDRRPGPAAARAANARASPGSTRRRPRRPNRARSPPARSRLLRRHRESGRAATVRPEARPMLAIPGVTAPPPRPPSAVRPQAARPVQARTSPFPHPPEALPSQSGYSPARSPSGMDGFPLTEPPSPPSLDALPSRPILHSGTVADRGHARERADTRQPADRRDHPTDDRAARRGDHDRAGSDRSSLGGAVPSMDGLPAPLRRPGRTMSRSIPRPTPRRGTGILGRLFGPPPPAPRPPSREAARTESRSRDGSDSEADHDPDLIARRRIERQIRATLGDKVRSFDVRITGRNVLVIAQPSRFWLRRSSPVDRDTPRPPGLPRPRRDPRLRVNVDDGRRSSRGRGSVRASS